MPEAVEVKDENGKQIMGAVLDNPNYFLAFKPANALLPNLLGKVENQNLHSLGHTDYIIITHSDFIVAANQLADFHRNHYKRRVVVADIEKIYNEFGGGRPDVTAMRDFVKMFYDRATDSKDQPQFLLLMGDASYDMKGIETHRSYVPSYNSRQSLKPPNSYNSDDYFSFLDEIEGNWGEYSSNPENHSCDIGVGRLPVESASEAEEVVKKIMNYVQNPTTLGNWRNKIVILADHKNGDWNTHIDQAEGLNKIIHKRNPSINPNKVYIDNYPIVRTSEGERCPIAKKEFINSVKNGALLVNYTGHGAQSNLTGAAIFQKGDIGSLNNFDNLSFWVTATCEWGRFDEPEFRSGGETLLLDPEGAAIGLFTSVRVVYAAYNYMFNANFYYNVFEYDTVNQRHRYLGEVYQHTKDMSWAGTGVNSRNFTLLGDPGIMLNYPQYQTVITKINQKNIDTIPQTLKGLSLVTIEGEIQNIHNQKLTNFNGKINPTVFDKPDLNITKTYPYSFFQQNNVLYNGLATVKNGEFTFQFVVPKNISTDTGFGKISLYAFNETTDAGGFYENIQFCCTDSSAIQSDAPPTIQLFINDLKWKNGGLITTPSPTLLATLADDKGINTTSLGVGREITAILDENTLNPIILNDFYQPELDKYNKGTISYNINELANGYHTLSLKIWDIANQSTTATTSFLVSSNEQLGINSFHTAPNPFSSANKFVFTHNKAGEELNIQIQIYSISGSLVTKLSGNQRTTNNLFEIEWDGTNNNGLKLSNGLYFYKSKVTLPRTNEIIEYVGKIVYIR